MTGKTHLLGGLTTGLLITTDITSICCSMVGSILPDLDMKLGIKHRTLTHTVWIAMLLAIINPYIALGVVSHILLDMCTKGGVKLFYPNEYKFRLPFAKYVKTNGYFEKFMRYLLIALIMWKLYYIVI